MKSDETVGLTLAILFIISIMLMLANMTLLGDHPQIAGGSVSLFIGSIVGLVLWGKTIKP